MKKYELTNETIEYKGKTLYRIRALRNFSDVKRGELGGFIEREDNLSHEGNCWVYDSVKVYDKAIVYGNAKIYKHVEIYENAHVYGNCFIYDNTRIYGYARISQTVYTTTNIGGDVIIDSYEKYEELLENNMVYLLTRNPELVRLE